MSLSKTNAIIIQTPAGYTVNIKLNGTAALGDHISSFPVTIDDQIYYFRSFHGGWETDYPYNDQPITASTVSITGLYGKAQWFDTDHQYYTTINNGETKTWNLDKDNFRIVINIAVDYS